MAVDLGDLIESVKRSVSSPGAEETTFPDANDDSWLGRLQDAFWECRLDGMLKDYVENGEGLISPSTGTVELTRDLQQLIILYASIDIVVNQVRALQTTFRAVAGPVQFEIQRSAQVLNSILNELRTRRNIVLERLSDVGAAPSFVIDSVRARDASIGWGDIDWVGY